MPSLGRKRNERESEMADAVTTPSGLRYIVIRPTNMILRSRLAA